MSNTFTCPSCGAEVKFTARVSVFAVCEYCRSTLLRKDLKLEHLGEMAVLQEDVSPLQLTTSGKFNGKHFTLIGRLQLAWKSGNWNEWYMYFDTGETGWLAEAQGFYMVNFEEAEITSVPPREKLAVGLSFPVKGIVYTVRDIKECTCVFSQGELPFKAVYGRPSVSVDCGGSDNRFACLDYSEDGTRLYIGKYQKFDDLKFSGLRQFDGW